MARNTGFAASRADVFDQVLRWLTERDRTEAQLRARLEKLGAEPEAISAAIKKASEYGYLNDRRAVSALVDREVQKHASRAAIASKLSAQGVSESDIEASLEAGGVSDEANATALLKKRRLTGVKAARFLAGRGFDESLIRALLPELDSTLD